jgi:RNA polymerase sigma factor (sigma-70 family)
MTTTHGKPTTPGPVVTHDCARTIVREINSDTRELERIVEEATAGDATAVSELVRRFTPRVRGVARAHRLGAHDIEDVMQTTWLRLLQRLGTVRSPSAIGAWLETTARHESLRILKKNNRERPTDDEVLFDAPATGVDENPRPSPERCATTLALALRQLPDHQRELLSMLFSDPAPPYTDISRALGMPIGSIGPTRARSLERLRRDHNLVVLADECLLNTA